MRKYYVILLLASFVLPSCIKKSTTVKQTAPATPVATKVQEPAAPSKIAPASGKYDEELGAYVLEDEGGKDLFEAAEAKVKGPEPVTQTVPEKPAVSTKADTDDSWAWQELDEDSSAEVIHFDFDRADIRKDQEPLVKYDAQLAKLAAADGATIVIEGHSCLITRSQLYNQALSQRRADAIKRAFIEQGVPASSIKAVGRGTSRVLTRASGKVAQAPNRRVEVKFLYQK